MSKSDSPLPSPAGDDGTLRLGLADELPSPLPEGIDRVVLVHPMLADHAAPGVWTELTARREAIPADTASLFLELRVDADNLIHLPIWAKAAHEHGVPVVLHLIDENEPRSLAHLDHDILAAVRQILRSWSKEAWGAEFRTGEGQTRIRRWQRSMTMSELDSLALPAVDHPLFADEALATQFLHDLLRIFDHPRVVGWLEELVHHEHYAARFLDSRPLRFAGYWLVASAQRRDEVARIALFRDAAHVLEVHRGDLEATRRSDWESWYDSWARELRIPSLERERTPFLEPAPAPAPAPSDESTEPRVTVIIPSYQHEEFIVRTIRSVLDQSRRDLAVIVADDASTDGTVEAARGIDDPRLSVMVNAENRGLGETISAALEQANTPYVAILNSDDLFHPDRLERCLSVLESDEKIELVATNLVPIDAQDQRISKENSSALTEGYKVCHWLDWFAQLQQGETGDTLSDLLRANHLLTSSNLVGRRRFFLDERRRWFRQEFCLDWQLLLTAAQRDGLHHLREPLLGYRLHARNTVWFDAERQWRYFVESHQVAAQVLRKELEAVAREEPADPQRLLELLSGPIQANSGLDGAGLLTAFILDQTGWNSRDLEEATRTHARTIADQAELRHEQRRFAEQVGDRRSSVRRMLGQIEFLREYRAKGEVLEEVVGDLEASADGLLADKVNLEALWHQAETERDQEIEEKTSACHSLTAAEEALEQSRHDLEESTRRLEESAQRLEESAQRLQESTRRRQESTRRLEESTRRLEESTRHLSERTAERDQLFRSGEYRFGDLILNKCKLRPLLQATETASAILRQWALRTRLRLERMWTRRPRVMATACWNFPIYSQTFVYQELTQLANKGYSVRFCYSHLEPRDHLPAAMQGLWSRRRKLILHRKVNLRDFDHYRRRMPEKVDRLLALLCEHSGKEADYILGHDNFLQAFSYTRHVEAQGSDYLHSYFFYDRSFMSLVAGFLLDLPRGVSCYADHLMEDYEFKLVRLHLELCDIVIATSARIKDELASLRPDIDPDKILVKPNAVDSETFPMVERADPPAGEPFRIVCVNRIEPKKGLTYLAEAVRLLNERGLHVELHQVGEADTGIQSSIDYRKVLVEQIERDQLWGLIHLEGRQNADGVRRFLGISQLFLAPFVETDSGDKDGIPTALLEAMATGIATVATDAGSMREVIDDGVDGLIVPQRDAAALADSIESLLRDPARRLELGRNAVEKVRTKFDVRICEKWFHDRLEKILAGRRG